MIKNNPEYQEEKQKFTTYYTENIVPALQPFEKERKKCLKRFMAVCLIIILWLGYVWQNQETYFFGNEIKYSGLILCVLILLLCWPIFGYYRKSKENLLPLIAGYFGDFSYNYQPKLSETMLKRSFVMKKYDRLDTDDCFEGKYDGVSVTITEYTRQEQQYRKRNGRREEYFAQIGHGLIFCAQMNKNFSGQTIVVRDKGIFNKLARYEKLKKVGLESTEFEKNYEVYSDNQIEARYILTTVMLEYMLNLKTLFSKIEYSFFDEQVIINIETKKNMFECSSFFRSVINQKRIEETFHQLYLLFSVIKILRLNQNKRI